MKFVILVWTVHFWKYIHPNESSRTAIQHPAAVPPGGGNAPTDCSEWSASFSTSGEKRCTGPGGVVTWVPKWPKHSKVGSFMRQAQLRNSMSRTWTEGQLDGFLCNQYLKLVVFRHFGHPCGQVEESKIDKDIFYEAKRLGCVTWSAVPPTTPVRCQGKWSPNWQLSKKRRRGNIVRSGNLILDFQQWSPLTCFLCEWNTWNIVVHCAWFWTCFINEFNVFFNNISLFFI